MELETTIAKALTEQEPVAWAMPRKDGVYIDVITPEEHARMPGQYTVPLYAAPQPRRRLTDEEIDAAWKNSEGCYGFARAVEAAIWSKS